MKKTVIYDRNIMQYKNGTLIINGIEYSEEYCKKQNKLYGKISRINKPAALLFWSDCKNGKFANWKSLEVK